MIYSVKGTLIHKEKEMVVVECAGVGYACRTTLSTLSTLGETGSEVMLYTHLNVREDCVELFGFATLQELNCFRMLISVSGVGPKAALSMLSDINPEKFALLVASEDSKALTKTKGIGAKIAQRIVLELKDKVIKENMNLSDGEQSVLLVSDNTAVSEAFSALLVLGYSQSEITPVLSALDTSLSSSELIRQSLKMIAQKMGR